MAKSGRIIGNPAHYRNAETERRYLVKGSGNKRGPYNKKKMIKQIKETEDLNQEIWRTLDEHDWCEVSSHGRIKSRGSLQEFPDGAIVSGRYMVHDIDNVGVWIRIRLWKEVLKIRHPDIRPSKCEFLDGNNSNCKLDNLYITPTYVKHLQSYTGSYTSEQSKKLQNEYYINKTTILTKIEEPIPLEYLDCLNESDTAEIKILRSELLRLIEFNKSILDKHQEEILKLKKENNELKRRIELGIHLR